VENGRKLDRRGQKTVVKAKEKRASYIQSARDDEKTKTTIEEREKGVIYFDL